MFHAKKVHELFEELETTENGLTGSEAHHRLETYGENKLTAQKKISPLIIFIRQFNSFIIYILVAASLISFILGEEIDAIVIGIILILIGFFGFIQEYRAEKAIEALKRMASLKAKVVRDGKKQLIDAMHVVPGDVILLETGDKIAADARVIEAVNLQTMEASLTGESTPVTKHSRPLPEKTVLAERSNMVYSGTIITAGRGRALVTGTGMKTEFGKIAKLISETESVNTPLQNKLQSLGKWLGIITIFICIIVTVGGILEGGDIIEMFMLGVSLAVAAIPEGLPAVVTIALALGVRVMVKKNALIRKLPSVETLGSTTVICSDKTGTLTCNEMTVRKLYVNNTIVDVTGMGYEPKGGFLQDGKKADTTHIMTLLQVGCMNNDATLDKGKVVGDPTEAALIVSAAKAGIEKDALDAKHHRVTEIPFTSERKKMTTVHSFGKKNVAYMKGAPEVVLESCNKIEIDGKVVTLTNKIKEEILKVNTRFAEDALRVLGFAYKEVQKQVTEDNFVFVGLQGMIDPPREEVKAAIKKCYKAGIKVVMITGDYEVTARAIAHELGIEGKAIKGSELEHIDLDKEVEHISIYARVNPEHKIQIVEALKNKGHIVAMTGDGVNDAPALKKADIGISMGITGTDVAKEASEMILTDDNFTSIVNAVEQGRGIYNNIKKFVNYLLSSNFGEVLLLFTAMLIGFTDPETGMIAVPLVAIQILWMNLVTDGLPALALGVDPTSPGVMEKKPRNPKQSIISFNMILNIIVIGIIMTVATLWIFNNNLHEDLRLAQTAAFTTLVFLEITRVYMVRMQYHNSFFSNKWLILALLSSIGMQLLVIYTPLNVFFKTVPLGWIQWVDIFVICAGAMFVGLTASYLIRVFTHEED